MTRKWVEGSEVDEGGHDKIRPAYREKFADRSMSRDFAERAWRLFLEKGDHYTEYRMLEEQYRVTGCPNCPVVSKGGKGNPTPAVDPNVGYLLDGVDDNEDWDLNGARGGEPAQRVGVKRRLLDLQDECRTEKWRDSRSVAKAVELAKEFLRPSDVLVNTISASEVTVSTGGDTTEIAAVLNKG